MQLTLSLLAFIGSALVSAQTPNPLDALATLPPCVQNCILNGITGQTECPATDPAVAECLCKSQAYYDATNACVSSCTPEEQQAAAAYAVQACPNGGIAVDAANSANATASATGSGSASGSASAAPTESDSASESASASASEGAASASASASESASAAVSSLSSGSNAAPTAMVVEGMKVLGALGLAVAAL